LNLKRPIDFTLAGIIMNHDEQLKADATVSDSTTFAIFVFSLAGISTASSWDADSSLSWLLAILLAIISGKYRLDLPGSILITEKHEN
jgi:hypothetical protein